MLFFTKLITKLKLIEVLLIIGLCMLGILIWEVHNTPGKYTKPDNLPGNYIFDTSTGKILRYIDGSSEADGECGWQVVRQPIPNRSHSLE